MGSQLERESRKERGHGEPVANHVRLGGMCEPRIHGLAI